MAHSNYGAALEKQGVEITLFTAAAIRWMATPTAIFRMTSGDTAVPDGRNPPDVCAEGVAYTGLSVQAVLDTEAAVYSGRRPLMPDWLMNLLTAPMRSPHA